MGFFHLFLQEAGQTNNNLLKIISVIKIDNVRLLG